MLWKETFISPYLFELEFIIRETWYNLITMNVSVCVKEWESKIDIKSNTEPILTVIFEFCL